MYEVATKKRRKQLDTRNKTQDKLVFFRGLPICNTLLILSCHLEVNFF